MLQTTLIVKRRAAHRPTLPRARWILHDTYCGVRVIYVARGLHDTREGDWRRRTSEGCDRILLNGVTTQDLRQANGRGALECRREELLNEVSHREPSLRSRSR